MTRSITKVVAPVALATAACIAFAPAASARGGGQSASGASRAEHDGGRAFGFHHAGGDEQQQDKVAFTLTDDARVALADVGVDVDALEGAAEYTDEDTTVFILPVVDEDESVDPSSAGKWGDHEGDNDDDGVLTLGGGIGFTSDLGTTEWTDLSVDTATQEVSASVNGEEPEPVLTAATDDEGEQPSSDVKASFTDKGWSDFESAGWNGSDNRGWRDQSGRGDHNGWGDHGDWGDDGEESGETLALSANAAASLNAVSGAETFSAGDEFVETGKGDC